MNSVLAAMDSCAWTEISGALVDMRVGILYNKRLEERLPLIVGTIDSCCQYIAEIHGVLKQTIVNGGGYGHQI